MKTLKDTIRLPKTDMPTNPNLAANEQKTYQSWDENNVFARMKRDGKNPFILHDGPPYANGDIHIGHALNKILKDFAVKFQFFNGRAVEFIPGWDCHGLPIEQKVRKNNQNLSTKELRKACREYASEQITNQMAQFKTLGVLADWGNRYETMSPYFEKMIYQKLCELVQKELITQRKKPVLWSWAERTALAEAEIEYFDKTDEAIYVYFPNEFKSNKDIFYPVLVDYPTFPSGFLVWTTTPWTLPANVAVAINPNLKYIAVNINDKVMIVAESQYETLKNKKLITGNILKVFEGKEFEGWKLKHPIYKQPVPVVMADFVSSSTGTGCVHIAPGHGEDDYLVGLKYNLPVVMPVGDDGKYTEGKYEGQHVFEANKIIINDLEKDNLLVLKEEITHSYPHCWRSGKPVIFRATDQFFLDLDKIRENVIKEFEKVDFIPSGSKNRMRPMLEGRPDWCISRQRAWGVPIAFNKVEGKLKEVGEKELDMWFDSGLTWNILNKQADLYLEGSDQHRGWFQSSLWLSVALTGQSPYKKVSTHGFVVDKDGYKMSKQKGNVISPLEITKKYGTEVLRFWVATTNYQQDVAIGDEIIKRSLDGYRKLRNTLRFFVANLDKEPQKTNLLPIDAWILSKSKVVFDEVHSCFSEQAYHTGMRVLMDYVIGDLSSIYMNAAKDRLYCGADTRESAVYTLAQILHSFIGLIAPLFTYTAQEVFSYCPEWFKKDAKDVFDLIYKPLPNIELDFDEIKWKKALDAFHIQFNKLKLENKAKETLEVFLYADGLFDGAEDWFVVSSIGKTNNIIAEYDVDGVKYTISISDKTKCDRCWKRNGNLCDRCKLIVED